MSSTHNILHPMPIDSATAFAPPPRTTHIPGMVNAHSHAFQRQLRGIGERPAPGAHAQDDFWSWRGAMFSLADSLTPESMYEIASRTYAEMAAAGYRAVGEFHYVHHQPDGTPYAEPNTMAHAVAKAAGEQGLTIALLPTAYYRAGWDQRDLPPTTGQRRFCDPTVDDFLKRVDSLRAWATDHPHVQVGVAAHSVRAVPADWLTAIAQYSSEHKLVRHIHAHEQRRELLECEREHGCTPIELLNKTGFLGEKTSVVHGVHVTDDDINLLAQTNTIVVTCPTTEGNLGDGYFPALKYRDAGVRIAIGSDSQVIIDPFAETRELETGARRERETRFGLLAHTKDLWQTLHDNGCASLGLDSTSVGRVEIDLNHPTLDSISLPDLPFALATSASAGCVL